MKVNHLMIAFATLAIGFKAFAYDHDLATYERIKAKFLSSIHCDPMEMITPKGQPSPVLMRILLKKLNSFEEAFAMSEAEQLGFDENFIAEVGYLRDTGGRNQRAIFILQKAIQQYLENPDFFDQPELKEEVVAELVENKVFQTTDGVAQCPFVSKDAFLRAVRGHRRVIRNQRNIPGLRNTNLLTIVDYTRPSNERRMFVLDLKNEITLENTWVAHGHGGVQSNPLAYSVFKGYDGSHRGGAAGIDGFGSYPIMSNLSGSNLSSDGFILAAFAGRGKTYGDNIRLEGIDENNRSMRSRSIIIHKWPTPYTNMTSIPDERDKEDMIGALMSYDARRDSESEARRIMKSLPYNVGRISPYMGATQGCLGIPEQLIPQFRDILPGSIIFTYSGADMQSKYLD